MTADDDNDEIFDSEHLQDAQLKVCQAFIQFNNYFSEYVKTMDKELWKKAVDYAKDSVDVPGVELRMIEDEDDDKE